MRTFDEFPTCSSDPEYDFYVEAAQEDPRYPVAAFCYLAKSVKRMLKRKAAEKNVERGVHVTGRDVCYTMRDDLLRDYGGMARDVLEQWNIYETSDFGNLVYGLIAVKLLSASPQDSRADFDDVFSFAQEFKPPIVGPSDPKATWEVLD